MNRPKLINSPLIRIPTRSIAVGEGISMSLSIVGRYFGGDGEDFFELGTIEADRPVGYTVVVTTAGDHTDAEVVLTFGYRDGTHAGFVTPLSMGTIESELEDVNADWTVVADDSAGAGPLVITFSRATLPAGEVNISIPLFDGEVDFPLGRWQWGEDSTPGGEVYYDGASSTFSMAGGSNEVAIASGGEVRTVEVGDLFQQVSIAPDPATDDEEVIIETATTVYSGSSGGTLTMVFQITDAVTCSEPTIDSNPGTWSQVGGWTSPGGGIQWEGTFTRSSVVSEGSYRIDFATTPSVTGTLVALADTEWSTIPYADGETYDVDVEVGVAVWTDQSSYAIGEDIIISWSGLTDPEDWINMVFSAAGPTDVGVWFYSNGTMTAPGAVVASGSHTIVGGFGSAATLKVRLLYDDGFTQLAVSPNFTVS